MNGDSSAALAPVTAPPIFTRDLALVTLGHFLQGLGYAVLVLLPLYLEHLHATRTEIGFLMGLPAVSALASRPLVAWALDVWGRKRTLVAGTVVLSAAMVLVGQGDRLGPAIYASRLLFGVGAGALFAGYFALASDLVPAERRTGGLALFGVSGLLPLMLNPVVKAAGFGPTELRQIYPWVGLLILLSIACLIPVREPARDAAPAGYGVAQALREVGRAPLWPVWVAVAVFSGLVSVAYAFLTVAAGKQGMENPAILWAAYACGATLVRLGGASWFDRLGPTRLVVPAVGAYAAALLVAAGARDEAAFLAAGALAGVGHGIAFPVLASLLIARAHGAFRGAAMSAMTALWEIMELSVPPACGAFSDRYGDPPMLVLVSLGGVVGLGLWTFVEHRLGGGAPRP